MRKSVVKKSNLIRSLNKTNHNATPIKVKDELLESKQTETKKRRKRAPKAYKNLGDLDKQFFETSLVQNRLWTENWLDGYQYYMLLINQDKLPQSEFPLLYQHPTWIYEQPINGHIYFLKDIDLEKDGKYKLGFPRTPHLNKKSWKWKRNNFPTKLPKNNPKIIYICATTEGIFKDEQGETTFRRYRMHIAKLVELYEKEGRGEDDSEGVVVCQMLEIEYGRTKDGKKYIPKPITQMMKKADNNLLEKKKEISIRDIKVEQSENEEEQESDHKTEGVKDDCSHENLKETVEQEKEKKQSQFNENLKNSIKQEELEEVEDSDSSQQSNQKQVSSSISDHSDLSKKESSQSSSSDKSNTSSSKDIRKMNKNKVLNSFRKSQGSEYINSTSEKIYFYSSEKKSLQQLKSESKNEMFLHSDSYQQPKKQQQNDEEKKWVSSQSQERMDSTFQLSDHNSNTKYLQKNIFKEKDISFMNNSQFIYFNSECKNHFSQIQSKIEEDEDICSECRNEDDDAEQSDQSSDSLKSNSSCSSSNNEYSNSFSCQNKMNKTKIIKKQKKKKSQKSTIFSPLNDLKFQQQWIVTPPIFSLRKKNKKVQIANSLENLHNQNPHFFCNYCQNILFEDQQQFASERISPTQYQMKNDYTILTRKNGNIFNSPSLMEGEQNFEQIKNNNFHHLYHHSLLLLDEQFCPMKKTMNNYNKFIENHELYHNNKINMWNISAEQINKSNWNNADEIILEQKQQQFLQANKSSNSINYSKNNSNHNEGIVQFQLNPIDFIERSKHSNEFIAIIS